MHWIEIIEPRPGRVGADFVGSRAIEAEGGPAEGFIAFTLDGDGREIKFNTRRLKDVVAADIDRGVGVVLS